MKDSRETLILRPMTMKDVARVVELDRKLFPLPWSERMFRNEVEKDGMTSPWVLEDSSGNIAGYIDLWLIMEELHIATIGVAPEWQGKGLGKILMLWGMLRGEEIGMEEATLEVRPSNTVAVNLYSSLGFRVVGRRKHYYGNKEDALIMTRRPLNSPNLHRLWAEVERRYELIVKSEERSKWENLIKSMMK